MILHRALALLCLLAFLTPLGARAQDTGTLHLRPLHIDFPATWVFDGSKRPIEGRGPQGEKVLISVARQRPGAASGPAQSARDMAQGLEDVLKGLAARTGKVLVRPVSEFPVPEGKVGYSSAAESSGFFGGKSYFLQYALVAPGAIFFFTVEGDGEALAALQWFDAVFATQRWDD